MSKRELIVAIAYLNDTIDPALLNVLPMSSLRNYYIRLRVNRITLLNRRRRAHI